MARHHLLLHGYPTVSHLTARHNTDLALSAEGTTWTWTSAPPLADPAGMCLPLVGFKGNHFALPVFGPMRQNTSKAQELES